jgi:Fic family protein
MNPTEFNGMAGELIFVQNQHTNYYSFVPRLLPVQIRFDDEAITLLAKTGFELGRLEAITNEFPEFAELQSRKEALYSARLHGNGETLDNLFRYERGKRSISDPKAAREAFGHIEALRACMPAISRGEITSHVILQAHKAMADSNNEKDSVIRTRQNWLGSPETPAAIARYVPPPPERVMPLLENALYYMQENEAMHPIVQLALFHYQFEAIRPFEHANGRTGRLLISVYLQRSKLLNLPSLCISEYFERDRGAYYDTILHVSKTGDYLSWVKFFLKAMHYQARKAVRTAAKLSDYRNACMKRLGTSKSAESSRIILDELFKNPYITIADARDAIDATYPTAKHAVERLVHDGILVQEKKERNRGFFAEKIYSIINEE